MATILNVAYPLAPVGRDTAGGAEQIVAQIDAALTARGHRSLVVATEDSAVTGTLVPTPAVAGALDDEVRSTAQAAHRAAIADALRRWPVDLVHLHGIDFDAYLPPPGPPALVTLHLPVDWYAPGALRPQRPATWLHCVSAAQRATAPGDLDLLEDVPNGVEIDALSARHAKRGFVVAMGRICPEKGFHLAIDAAKAADVPLLLAGRVFGYAAHEAYFREEIVPRLDHWRRFVGPVGFARKRRLLSAARCVLVPSLCAETGSLVAMEALACGTAVVAFPNGALADVVEEGLTGFLVNGVEEMAEAIARTAFIDPDACRDSARERFSASRMVERYLDLYARLAGSRRQVA